MLVEIKDWQDDLQAGDLTYYKGTLLKVTRRRESKDGKTRTVKFRRVGKVKLKAWVPPPPVALEQNWDRDTGNGFNERGYPAGLGIYHDPMG